MSMETIKTQFTVPWNIWGREFKKELMTLVMRNVSMAWYLQPIFLLQLCLWGIWVKWVLVMLILSNVVLQTDSEV